MSPRIKCLVWDLDETLWSGTLVEGDTVALRPGVVAILDELTARGIVNSISSHNDREPAMAELRRLGVDGYFVAVQIDHDPKPDNLRAIADELNISLDALAFIDNDPFERAAVEFAHPEVRVIAAEEVEALPQMAGFGATNGTAESRDRLQGYREEAARREAEEGFGGSRLDFLTSCSMVLTLREAVAADVDRLVELAERTNQFNSSGLRYRADEIEATIADPSTTVIVADLADRFGDAGRIGAMIIRADDDRQLLESLMVSCRVDGRGVPQAMLVVAMRLARDAGADASFVRFNATERNRRLAFLYRMMGFGPTADDASLWAFDFDAEAIPAVPGWLTLEGPIAGLDG